MILELIYINNFSNLMAIHKRQSTATSPSIKRRSGKHAELLIGGAKVDLKPEPIQKISYNYKEHLFSFFLLFMKYSYISITYNLLFDYAKKRNI